MIDDLIDKIIMTAGLGGFAFVLVLAILNSSVTFEPRALAAIPIGCVIVMLLGLLFKIWTD